MGKNVSKSPKILKNYTNEKAVMEPLNQSQTYYVYVKINVISGAPSRPKNARAKNHSYRKSMRVDFLSHAKWHRSRALRLVGFKPFTDMSKVLSVVRFASRVKTYLCRVQNEEKMS